MVWMGTCEDATEVWVVREEDSEHVPNLPLVPVRRFEDVVYRVDRGKLVRVGFHADS